MAGLLNDSVEDTKLLKSDDSRVIVAAEMPKPLGSEYAFEGVPIVRNVDRVPDWACCSLCDKNDNREHLFRPCKCDNSTRYFHRECFRRWRTGWINPRNYFCCPDCMFSYRIERVKSESIRSDTKERISRHFRIRMLLFYLGMLLVLFAFIGGIAGIAYAADDDDKNVPVGVKYMLSSVVNGFPSGNATKNWRNQFKQPDTAVWPYYTLLGTFCAAICVLILFACIGCTFDENERRRRSCSDQCGCGGRSRSGGSTGDVYLTYWGCYNCGTPCDACYCPCDECCDNTCNSSTSGGCGGCGGCSGGGGGGDCKGGEVLLILILVIIVVVILSAIVVVILYTIKKWTLFHDRMTDMIQNQASELESETIVLGIDENLRPLDAV